MIGAMTSGPIADRSVFFDTTVSFWIRQRLPPSLIWSQVTTIFWLVCPVGGGGGLFARGGVCPGVSAQRGGVCPEVSARGVYQGGVSAQCMLGYTPPLWTEWQTDRFWFLPSGQSWFAYFKIIYLTSKLSLTASVKLHGVSYYRTHMSQCKYQRTNSRYFLFLCRFGRRKAILLFCIIRSVGGIMCVVAPAYEWFAVARVITGAGIMGGTITTFVLG